MNASSLIGGIKGFNPEMLMHRIAPRLPLILTWLLALAIGVQAAVIVRNLLAARQPAGNTAAVVESTGGTNSRPAIDLPAIVNAHLFGVAAAPDTAAGNPADAPETRLSLVLTGTIASSDPKSGLGFIGETAATTKVYSVGSTVAGGARLNAVYNDRVILERNGQLEALLLPRQYKGGPGTPPPAAAARSPNAILADRVRRLVAQDPGSVAEIMRPQPVFANGQQRGYRVYPGRNRQQFTQLGLRPGDLVMAVNGTPLDDPARGMEIFRSIGSSSQVRVTVERNGKSQELVLNMSELANQAQALGGGGGEGMVPVDQAPPVEPEAPATE